MSGQKVIDLAEHRCKNTIAVLRELLERAEAGHLRAFAYCFKSGPHRHRWGVTGDYRTNLTETSGAVARLGYGVNELALLRDVETDTRAMQL